MPELGTRLIILAFVTSVSLAALDYLWGRFFTYPVMPSSKSLFSLAVVPPLCCIFAGFLTVLYEDVRGKEGENIERAITAVLFFVFVLSLMLVGMLASD